MRHGRILDRFVKAVLTAAFVPVLLQTVDLARDGTGNRPMAAIVSTLLTFAALVLVAWGSLRLWASSRWSALGVALAVVLCLAVWSVVVVTILGSRPEPTSTLVVP